MAGVDLKISLQGMERFFRLLRRLQPADAQFNRRELHLRYGIQTLNWVQRNFRQEGGLTNAPWAKLKPSTIAQRRRGSSKVLQDTGALMGSFNVRYDENEAAVGSPMEVAKYHQFGTKGPYDIYPKNAKALAWKAAGEFSSIATQRLRTSKVRASFSSIATQKTYKRGEKYILAAHVVHPGLPARRMLPREDEIMPILLKTTLNYIDEIKRGIR